MSDMQNKNDLFEMIEKKDLKELECFLSDNTATTDVNIQDIFGYTPLSVVCWGWKDSELGIRAMELLLERGADVNIQNENGYTPLHFVCSWWNVSDLTIRAMELLLERGADVNIQNENGNTPLNRVCWRWSNPHLVIRAMELLLDRGADVNIQNDDGDTPLELLQENNPNTKTTEFLEEYSTHVRVRSLRGMVIQKIKKIKTPTEGMPSMCLELPDEFQSSKDLKCENVFSVYIFTRTYTE